MYSEELSKRLASELSGKLESAVLLWLKDPAGRDASIIRKSLVEIRSLEGATEVICSRTPSQLQYLKQVYHSLFGVYLEHDIQANTSPGSDHQKLLLAYISTHRPEGPEVNREIAQKDAKVLYKAGEKKLGTDEKTFIHIFSERSAAHLAAVSAYYHDMYGHSLKKVLHKSMKGLGTDDSTLIRVIVTRTEVDMQYIKAEYSKKHKKTLNDAVHSETSGHYRAFLLSLLGPNI
ncbi:hypothetical protein V8G54_013339 [Vigna mungo]|uniref:Annexin n=1 Tax=Vigna mungo TaxID=3915 RepID=A0AAQ3NWP4_VIGMU